MPIEEQHALELMVEVRHTQKRLQREEGRLAKERSSTQPQKTKELLFGKQESSPHELFNSYLKLKELQQALKEFDRVGLEGKILFKQLQAEVEEHYQELQPLLAKQNPERFHDEFILACDDEEELSLVVDELMLSFAEAYQPQGLLGQIQQLALNSDFSQAATQEQFLQLYQQIQPYLYKVNYQYDSLYFLRELQNADDFHKAATNIGLEIEKLNELIEGLEKTKVNKISLAEDRLVYIEALLNKQVHELGPQKVEAFKEKLFNQHVQNKVKERLSATMGSYAELFIQYSQADFNAHKPELLADLSLKNELETSINARIDELVPSLVAKNTDAVKELIFINCIKQHSQTAFGQELGAYTELFIQQLSPLYRAEQDAILKGLALDKELGQSISKQLDQISPQALEKRAGLKKGLAQLNQFSQALQKLIDLERSNPNQNSNRIEKLSLLEQVQKHLNQIERIPIDAQGLQLEPILSQAKKELLAIQKNDAYLQIDDLKGSLTQMLLDEKKQPLGNPCREEKISSIERMLQELDKPNRQPTSNTANYLAEKQQKITQFSEALTHYDSMIDLYSHITEMRAYARTSSTLSKNEKLQPMLSQFQTLLSNQDKTGAQRLIQLKMQGLSSECQKILNKNCSSTWSTLCEVFNKILVALHLKDAPAPDHGQALIASFKDKIHQIKDHPAPPVAQNAVDEEEGEGEGERQHLS